MDFSALLVGITMTLGTIDLVLFVIMATTTHKSRGLSWVGLLFLLGGIYATGYALELSADTLEMKLLFNHIQYIGLPFIAIAWLYIARTYFNPNKIHSRRQLLLVSLVPVLTFLAVISFPYFQDFFYYTSAALDTENVAHNLGFIVLELGKGPWYYVQSAYNLLLLGWSAILYFHAFFRNSGDRNRSGALWMGVFSVAATAGSIFTFFSPQTAGIDITLYFLLFIGFFSLYTMMRFEYFDLKNSALRAAFETLDEPSMILGDQMEIVSWNEALQRAGFPAPKSHMPLEEFIRDPEVIGAIREGRTTEYTWFDKKFLIESMPLSSRKGRQNGSILRFNDMTLYFSRMETLHYEATHDELTRLLNRRAFMEEAEAYMKECQFERERFAMIMLDIDDFKNVNDTYGHVIGDCVLEQLAVRISAELPPEAVFCRYGGEEFMILMKKTTHEAAEALGEKVRSSVCRKRFIVGDLELDIRISLGIGFGDTSISGMLRDYVAKADEAMYQSKKAGKNRVTSIR